MRCHIEQATDRARRALRELDAAAAVLENEGAPPVDQWIDNARRATEGALQVLEAHRATAVLRRRAARSR